MTQPDSNAPMRGPVRGIVQKADGSVVWYPDASGAYLGIDGVTYVPRWLLRDEATGGWIRFFSPSETG